MPASPEKHATPVVTPASQAKTTLQSEARCLWTLPHTLVYTARGGEGRHRKSQWGSLPKTVSPLPDLRAGSALSRMGKATT